MKFYVSFWLLAFLALGVSGGVDIIPFILAVALHESGHLAALKILGGRIGEIKANLSGVAIKTINKGISTVKDEVFLNIAGPIMGLLGALLAWHLYFKEFALVNLFMSLFNLLPIEGLDGGTIACELLGCKFGERGRAIALNISRVVTIAIVIAIAVSALVLVK